MEEDEPWDELWDRCYIGGVGHVTTLSETPKLRRKKVYKRPIGFNTNLDKLELADE